MEPDIAIEILDSCPHCNSTNTHPWCMASDLLLRTTCQRYEYYRCMHCNVLYLRTRPQVAELSKVYPKEYHPYLSKNVVKDGLLPRRKRFHKLWRFSQKIVSKIRLFESPIRSKYKAIAEGSTFLDFGCGAGKFLDQMRLQGCITIGMDFSHQALREVERKGHMALSVSPRDWARLGVDSVDFVRMNHVVEHLYHARGALNSLRERMKPGAVLHVAVPNPSGVSAALFGHYWHGLDCPRHVILYSPSALKQLLEDCGFSVSSMHQEVLTKDHIRSWVYRLQATGYLINKNPNTYMTRFILQLLAIVPMMVAALLGRADRFHAFARRAR